MFFLPPIVDYALSTFQFMTVLPTRPGDGPILLIDDDEFIAGSLRDYLITRGLAVDVALEPAAAEALMRERHYGTIVVDPFLTGAIHDESATLIGKIRSLQPRSSVMILTGYGSAAVLHAAASDAGTTLLFKPQSITHLSQLIVDSSSSAPSIE